MKFSLLMFVLTSFVLNACCGLLSGDPAPGRSPGPPVPKLTTLQVSDATTIRTIPSNIHQSDTNHSDSLNTDATNDETQHKNQFSAEPPNKSDVNDNNNNMNMNMNNMDNSNNNGHTEHIKKPHGNSAATHHKFDKFGKIASKAGKNEQCNLNY